MTLFGIGTFDSFLISSLHILCVIVQPSIEQGNIHDSFPQSSKESAISIQILTVSFKSGGFTANWYPQNYFHSLGNRIVLNDKLLSRVSGSMHNHKGYTEG